MTLDMPLEEAIRTRRSIRRLEPDPVDDALILELLDLALKAPTGGNRQNAEFVVAKDPGGQRRLERLNRVAWNTCGRFWKLFARGDEKTLRSMKAVDWEVAHYGAVPAAIAACLRCTGCGPIVSGWRPPFSLVLTSIYYGSIFPPVQDLLLAARARASLLGLAGGRDPHRLADRALRAHDAKSRGRCGSLRPLLQPAL